ncbi:MAG: HEAT repeat domain-containing protein, partial [Phycisphaerae bacterium]|nr:HEAT repeat domain-containing protein [Phycisphaerae bacterium]
IRDQQIEMRGGKLANWDVWGDVFGLSDETLGVINIGEKTHTSMTSQLHIAAALGGLGSKAGYEPALTIVNFTGWDEWHRCTAAYALGRIGDRRALRDLEYLFLTDRNADQMWGSTDGIGISHTARHAALGAIELINGRRPKGLELHYRHLWPGVAKQLLP